MAQPKKRLDQLLHQFIYRSADPKEESLLWQWLWQLDIPEQDTVTDNSRQERLWNSIYSHTLITTSRRRQLRPWRLAAAAALLCGVIAIACWWLLPQQQSVVQYVITSDSQHLKSVLLPDGTSIQLNVSSSLTYASDYNKVTRRVILQGEGYFKVAADGQRPFIVQSGELETKVLGTAFNIEAHKGATQIRIALTAGKIVVYPIQHPQQKTLLEPGQLLRYEPGTGNINTGAFSYDVTTWTTGGLSFNGIPLSEAIRKIATHYHIQIQYHPQQNDRRTVTASLEKTSWQKALSAILFPHNLTYRVKDSTVIIH